jgi:hypothetical protein
VTEIDLAFIARQLDRLTTDVNSMRDDMRGLTAIVIRQDSTLTALLTEVHDTHTQIARMNDSHPQA